MRSLVGAAGLLVVACIIPDRDIQAEGGDRNPGAVRIVESIPLLDELRVGCQQASEAEDEEERSALLRYCPQVPEAMPQGIIRGGPYCSCPGRDENTLPEFFIYAEDPDRRRDEPADRLYAVALRDLDPLTDAPQTSVAYPEHFNPGGSGDYVEVTGLSSDDSIPVEPSVGREPTGLWRFRFSKDGGQGVDLCNDDDGETLPVGLHTLQIMITDRPFLRPVRLDENGDEILDENGDPKYLRTQYGMPDLAIGATWAVANYVFNCEDPEVQPDCACAGEAP